jgi:hypothetical protein
MSVLASKDVSPHFPTLMYGQEGNLGIHTLNVYIVMVMLRTGRGILHDSYEYTVWWQTIMFLLDCCIDGYDTFCNVLKFKWRACDYSLGAGLAVLFSLPVVREYMGILAYVF